LNYIREDSAIYKDLSKVHFDWENYFCEIHPSVDSFGGLVTLPNGLTVLCCNAGGDWEAPVCFILYWDGKQVRAYIPDRGNLWNRKSKRAYGNDLEADKKDYCQYLKEVYKWKDAWVNSREFDANDFNWYDTKLMISDIMNRIEYVGKETGITKEQHEDLTILED
jgi:hypothetical protein